MNAKHRFVFSFIVKTSLFLVLSLAVFLVWVTQVHDRSIFKTEKAVISHKLSKSFYQIMKDMGITRVVASSSNYLGSRVRIYKGDFIWDHELKYVLKPNDDFVLLVTNKKLMFFPEYEVLPSADYNKYKARIKGIIEAVIEREIDHNVKKLL